MISQETIKQIQNRIDIIEIVGGFVRLKKRGINYLGLCPFHNEKTPSFTVSPTKEIYKCFGCGKSGNAISFLMEHEKFSYVEALRWLANKYNVEIEEKELSPEARQQQQAAESLYILNNFAGKYFEQTLFEHEQGRNIGLSYLKERGFREEVIKKFQLGFCLEERDAFARTALKAQFSAEILQKSGLAVQRDDRLVDNYRGRIIFPIHNTSGKILGFGARQIASNTRVPKYINTPENDIYQKSKLLYGAYFARQAIDKQQECLLVEGYTDVISLHQAGIENVVASGGTSLTTDQLRLIRKYTPNLTIIYDGDAAGVKAALRGLDLALDEGLQVKLVLIPDKEDPDSYLNKIGPKAFLEFIQQEKKDFILFQLETHLRDAGNDAAKKAAAVNQVAETIARINKLEDFTLQQNYIRRSADLLKIDETGLTALVNKFIRAKVTRAETASEKKADPSATVESLPEDDDSLLLLQQDEPHERALIRCLLEFGLKPWEENRRVADHILEEMKDQELVENPSLLELADMYEQWYREGLEPTPKNFLYHEDQSISGSVIALMDFPYELSPNWHEHYEGKMPTREDLYVDEINSTINYLKLRKIRRMMDDNQKDLERPHTPDEQLMLIRTHQHLKKLEQELVAEIGTVILK